MFKIFDSNALDAEDFDVIRHGLLQAKLKTFFRLELNQVRGRKLGH